MVQSARVAETFAMDPVVVAGERDPLVKAWRIAAHNVVVREANERLPKIAGSGH